MTRKIIVNASTNTPGPVIRHEVVMKASLVKDQIKDQIVEGLCSSTTLVMLESIPIKPRELSLTVEDLSDTHLGKTSYAIFGSFLLMVDAFNDKVITLYRFRGINFRNGSTTFREYSTLYMSEPVSVIKSLPIDASSSQTKMVVEFKSGIVHEFYRKDPS